MSPERLAHLEPGIGVRDHQSHHVPAARAGHLCAERARQVLLQASYVTSSTSAGRLVSARTLVFFA